MWGEGGNRLQSVLRTVLDQWRMRDQDGEENTVLIYLF